MFLAVSVTKECSQIIRLMIPVDRSLREVVVPEFDGDSYLELPTLENVGTSFAIEVWFLARSPDGVLLYNGQGSGGGDFVAINLKDGHLEFVYNLGSGLCTLRWEMFSGICLLEAF